ncbi:hypothetical protein ACTFIR_011821 [Dictyostelium discoideum]
MCTKSFRVRVMKALRASVCAAIDSVSRSGYPCFYVIHPHCHDAGHYVNLEVGEPEKEQPEEDQTSLTTMNKMNTKRFIATIRRKSNVSNTYEEMKDKYNQDNADNHSCALKNLKFQPLLPLPSPLLPLLPPLPPLLPPLLPLPPPPSPSQSSAQQKQVDPNPYRSMGEANINVKEKAVLDDGNDQELEQDDGDEDEEFKPNKRQSQVLLAIDDAESMNTYHIGGYDYDFKTLQIMDMDKQSSSEGCHYKCFNLFDQFLYMLSLIINMYDESSITAECDPTKKGQVQENMDHS